MSPSLTLQARWRVVEADGAAHLLYYGVRNPPRHREQWVPVSAELAEKETTPPPPYTEASLLAAMEHAGRRIDDEELAAQMRDSGLGTPATRAAIIDRLIQVQYIRRV